MKTLIFLAIICFSASIVMSSKLRNNDNKNNKIKCDVETIKRVDTCAEKLWFVGKNSRKYPENDEELKIHCKQTTNLIKCVKDFTDTCAKGVQKQLANVMLYTVKMNQKTYCNKPAKRDELLAMSSCGNGIRTEASACMEGFLTGLGKANLVDLKFKVPQACCAFHELKSCIMKSAKKVGSPLCGDNQLENLERYITAMAGNTLNLMCNEYDDESDKCSKLPPLPKTAKLSKPPSIIVGFGQILTSL